MGSLKHIYDRMIQQCLTLFPPWWLAVARDFNVWIFSKTRFTFLLVVSSLSLLLKRKKQTPTDKHPQTHTEVSQTLQRQKNNIPVFFGSGLIPGCSGNRITHSQLRKGSRRVSLLWSGFIRAAKLTMRPMSTRIKCRGYEMGLLQIAITKPGQSSRNQNHKQFSNHATVKKLQK